MTIADIVILIIVLVSAFIGFRRGLTWSLLSLVTWVAAGLLAYFFADEVAGLWQAEGLPEAVQVQSRRFDLSWIGGFCLILVTVYLVGAFIRHQLANAVDDSDFASTVDRTFGGIFGFLRGLVIVLIVLVLMGPYYSGTRWWHDSLFIPYLSIYRDDVRSIYDELVQPRQLSSHTSTDIDVPPMEA